MQRSGKGRGIIIQKIKPYGKDVKEKYSYNFISDVAKRMHMAMYFFENNGDPVAIIGRRDVDTNGTFVCKSSDDNIISWHQYHFDKLMSYKRMIDSKFTLYITL